MTGSNGTHAQSNGTNGDADVDDATVAFDELALKKKKKSKKVKETEDAPDAEAPADDGELDLAALKKKKKKKAAKTEADDFEARLGKAGVDEKSGDAEEEESVQQGDMDEGTGIWAHNASQPINYNLLLQRFFKMLNEHNPDIMAGGTKSYKIPPPQCLREGNKKTIFANIADIAKRLKRSDEHITSFLFAELGTTGSVDGSRRLVIKGKFLQKQIENVLRRYIVEYVTCKTCHSHDTELVRGENRLYFILCNSCFSRRSVSSIKTGFTAQVGKRRRQQG